MLSWRLSRRRAKDAHAFFTSAIKNPLPVAGATPLSPAERKPGEGEELGERVRRSYLQERYLWIKS
jgi:hypothetical protein